MFKKILWKRARHSGDFVLQKERKPLHRNESRGTNAQKNRKHPATARSGRANQRNRGAKRHFGYIEVRAHRSRLAAALGHWRSHQDDCRRWEVPGLRNAEEDCCEKKAEGKKDEAMMMLSVRSLRS